jgi:hypothetical protein
VPEFNPTEIELCRRIFEDSDCASLEVTASISRGVGLTILQRGRLVGWWYVAAGRLCYSTASGSGPAASAENVDAALHAIVAMAKKQLWHQPLQASLDANPV